MLLVLPWYQASVVSCVINYLRIATLQFIGTNLNLLALLRVILFETAHYIIFTKSSWRQTEWHIVFMIWYIHFVYAYVFLCDNQGTFTNFKIAKSCGYTFHKTANKKKILIELLVRLDKLQEPKICCNGWQQLVTLHYSYSGLAVSPWLILLGCNSLTCFLILSIIFDLTSNWMITVAITVFIYFSSCFQLFSRYIDKIYRLFLKPGIQERGTERGKCSLGLRGIS